MKKVKSVSFNVSDPYELALFIHSNKHKYFSTYVKRLIARDMEHGEATNLDQYFKASEIYDIIETKDK